MEIIIKKSSNVYLYKLALEEFIRNNSKNSREIKDIDYLVGIMFLTELNRYCKLNKLHLGKNKIQIKEGQYQSV